MGTTVRLPRKLKKGLRTWFEGKRPTRRVLRWAAAQSLEMKARGGPDYEEWQRVQRMVRLMRFTTTVTVARLLAADNADLPLRTY